MENKTKRIVIGARCRVCGTPFLNEQLANGTLIPEHSDNRLSLDCVGSNKLGDDIFSTPIHRIRKGKISQ